MKSSKWLRLAAALLALSLLGAACGGDDDPDPVDEDPGGDEEVVKTDVTVYFQGALSGPYNYLVIPAFQGAQLRVDELNEDESFPATITLARGDTQGSGDQAAPIVEEVVSDPNTVAVIGPAF